MRALVACWALAAAVLAGCGTDEGQPERASPESSPTTAASTASPSRGASGPAYVALGDSYTAAGGVPVTVDAACGRSSVNYPTLVAEELGLELTDVSCNAASTTSLVGAQQTLEGPVPAQFAALTEDTDYVTMGIGGNDEDFLAQIFTTCLDVRHTDPEGTPCRDAMNEGGTDVLVDALELIEGRLTSALVGIRDRSPDATIVMVGYPQIVPEEGTCDELPLSPDDYDYVRGLMAQLGAATEKAAAEADVEYVDVLAASDGHDICAGEDAWVNGLRTTDLAAPMHPFAEEQAAVAELVVEAFED